METFKKKKSSEQNKLFHVYILIGFGIYYADKL